MSTEDRLTRIERERKLLAVYTNRVRALDSLDATLFPEQRAFINDPSRLKAALCSRRAGKSYSAGVYFFKEMLRFPQITCLYIATTRDQAKRIMYKDILKSLNRKFKLGMSFNETTLQVTADNGSFLYLMGVDSSPDEAEKALGQKYKLVIIDEGASHKQDLRYLVYSVLFPACADYLGTVCMIGSTGNRTDSLFYDVTGRAEGDPQKEPGWSFYKWDWRNNPYTKEQVQHTINLLKENNPHIEETSSFRQMYLNEWVIDSSNYVYRYIPERILVPVLPPKQNYYYTLSIDLGYSDDTAITIAAYAESDPNMYFVEAFKRKKMTITDVAQMLDMYKIRYRPVKWVIDGQSKQAVEELRQRFGFPLIAADKQGKADIIEIMNGDLTMGKIKILPAAMQIVEEWKNLTWDSTSEKRVESANCPNHLSDSALYNWRSCYHFATKPDKDNKPKTVEQEMDEWEERESLRIQKAKQNKSTDFVLRDFKSQFYR